VNTSYVQIPAAVGVQRWPVVSAVRVGTSVTPAEFIVIADCRDDTARQRYATLRVFVGPGQVESRDGEYDLAWQQAQRSLAERAGLIPRRRVEVLVYSSEPHDTDEAVVFIDGDPPGPDEPITVDTHVVYLDIHDDEDEWMGRVLRNAARLSPAARQDVTNMMAAIAQVRGVDLEALDV
jgi:hypothetical protein